MFVICDTDDLQTQFSEAEKAVGAKLTRGLTLSVQLWRTRSE